MDKKQLIKQIKQKEIDTFSIIRFLSGENNEGSNDPKEFYKLTDDQKIQLVTWILNSLRKIKSYNESNTSYGMKHIFAESILGFYVCNGVFKEAMLICGFEVKDVRANNWIFNVSGACCNALSKQYFKNKREWQ